jgi:hypothetical protein
MPSFDDEEVLSNDFQDKIKAVLDVVSPFVHMYGSLLLMLLTTQAQ